MDGTVGRIGLIGDIHAEDGRLARALDILAARGVERVLATGDIADGAGSVARCCELLAAHGVLVVRGNHDRWLLAGELRDLPAATPPETLDDSTRAMLAALPVTLEIATVGGPALLCHGIGSNDMSKLNPDDHGYAVAVNEELQELLRTRRHRWVLNGHSHKRMVRHFPGVSIINAGTLKRGEEAGFFELDFAAGVARLFEFEGPGVTPALDISLFP